MAPKPVPASTRPESMAGAVAAGLDPRTGHNLAERVGPLLILLAWLALGGLLMFDVVPDPEFAKSFWGILGVPVGAFLRHMGR